MMEIAPVGRIPAFTISSTMRCVSHAVGEAGLTTMGTPGKQRGCALFTQTPCREIECVDENSGALCRHQKMLSGKHVGLRQGDHSALFQYSSLSQCTADLGVILHGVDRTIHVKGGIRLRGAGIEEGEAKIFIAICREHIGDLGEQVCTLSITEIPE